MPNMYSRRLHAHGNHNPNFGIAYGTTNNYNKNRYFEGLDKMSNLIPVVCLES